MPEFEAGVIAAELGLEDVEGLGMVSTRKGAENEVAAAGWVYLPCPYLLEKKTRTRF